MPLEVFHKRYVRKECQIHTNPVISGLTRDVRNTLLKRFFIGCHVALLMTFLVTLVFNDSCIF